MLSFSCQSVEILLKVIKLFLFFFKQQLKFNNFIRLICCWFGDGFSFFFLDFFHFIFNILHLTLLTFVILILHLSDLVFKQGHMFSQIDHSLSILVSLFLMIHCNILQCFHQLRDISFVELLFLLELRVHILDVFVELSYFLNIC